MDGRDPPAGGGDGPSEDDRALSVTAALAREAAGFFQSRRYSECVDVLEQLSRLKEEDPKVTHNFAVAAFFHDGCSDGKKLLDVLKKVKKRSEDLALASREEVEASGTHESNAGMGSAPSTTTLYQFSAANSGHVTYAEELDTSVINLNMAIIHFHMQEYEHALSILEPLFQNVEHLDEVTTLHICHLLLDVALASQDTPRAADVIQYLDKCFGVGFMMNQADNGTVTQNQSSNQGASAHNTVTVQDASGSDPSISANIPEVPLGRKLSDDALEYENLISTIDGGAPNLVRSTSNDVPKSSVDRTASTIDLKLNIQLYKVRFLLLTRNLKLAKREVKLAMNIARGRDSSTVLMLKSQLEYARGNHRKAVKLLMTSSNRTEPEMQSMFYNNLGCIHYQLGQHHTSAFYFSKAVRSCSALRSEKPLKLSTYSQDRSSVILYNCGLQFLARGNPLAAARCFFRAAAFFYKRPLFWLRFAECCLLAQEKGLLRQNASDSSGEDVKLPVIGSGKWRHLAVEDVNSRNRHLDSIGADGRFGSNDQFRLSLPFAQQCLLNALHLLTNLEKKKPNLGVTSSAAEADVPNQSASGSSLSSNHKNGSDGDSKASIMTSGFTLTTGNSDSKETKSSISSSTVFQGYVSSYEGMHRKENLMIKQAVLGDLAYVELSLENPLKALTAAKSLQQLPDCSRMYMFLSYLYAAEALCLLNRPEEAAEQLSVYITDGTNINLPYTDEDIQRWKVEGGGDGEDSNNSTSKTTAADVFMKPKEARGSLYLNLAVVSAIEGNLEQARRFITEAQNHLPNNPRAVLAMVYLDLVQGKVQDALAKLKRRSHVRFHPGSAGSS